MQKIKIGSREYDYIVSAAVAKKHGKLMAEMLEANEKKEAFDSAKMIDTFAAMLRDGMLSARLGLLWPHRLWLSLWKPIPSEERILNLLDLAEMQNVLMPDGKEEGSGKK